ncbi:hypothetical protein DFS33DRAFT_175625 [Desarmillaria ectypa]|nr:hypothetical protein DFS33DRAFT_175625 [Desarmillaria ectypa]
MPRHYLRDRIVPFLLLLYWFLLNKSSSCLALLTPVFSSFTLLVLTIAVICDASHFSSRPQTEVSPPTVVRYCKSGTYAGGISRSPHQKFTSTYTMTPLNRRTPIRRYLLAVYKASATRGLFGLQNQAFKVFKPPIYTHFITLRNRPGLGICTHPPPGCQYRNILCCAPKSTQEDGLGH